MQEAKRSLLRLGQRTPIRPRLFQQAERSHQIRLHELTLIKTGVIDLASLKAAKIVGKDVETAKVIASGKIDKAVKLKGIKVTPGARKAIEAAGGSIED